VIAFRGKTLVIYFHFDFFVGTDKAASFLSVAVSNLNAQTSTLRTFEASPIDTIRIKVKGAEVVVGSQHLT
jgi:hypothetical protein